MTGNRHSFRWGQVLLCAGILLLAVLGFLRQPEVGGVLVPERFWGFQVELAERCLRRERKSLASDEARLHRLAGPSKLGKPARPLESVSREPDVERLAAAESLRFRRLQERAALEGLERMRALRAKALSGRSDAGHNR